MAGQMAVFAAAILLSTSGLTIKLLDWHPLVITGIRSFIAAVFLLVIRFIAVPPKNVKNRPVPLFATAFMFAFMMIAFVSANKFTTAANAVLLLYSAPVWAALLGWRLIKEKPGWENWGALVFIFAGMALFLRDGLGRGSLFGDGLAVLAGIFFASFSVFTRMLKDGNPGDAMLLAHIICAIIGIPFIFLFPPEITASSLLVIFYMGIIQIGLASILFAYGLKRVRAVQALLISTVEPLLNPVWVFVITGEKPALAAVTGGAIIIAAVLASSIIGKRRENRHNQFS